MNSSATPLAAEAETLRRVAARHDFAATEASAHEYARLLEACLPTLDASQREIQLREGLELFEWCRRTLRAAHTRLADDLGRLQVQMEYQALHLGTVNTWRVEG